MRRFVRFTSRAVALLAVALTLAAAPCARAVEGGNSDSDLDDDEGLSMPSGKVEDPDVIAPPDAKPRAHDVIPFPDAQPREHDEIAPPDAELPE